MNRTEVNLRDIKEINSLTVNASTGVDEVNRYLSNGWILIDKYKPDDFTLIFVMGGVETGSPAELEARDDFNCPISQKE